MKTDVFTVTVNDTKPIWIYCAQGAHCESGMAMVINQPASPNTLANYLIAAKNAKSATPSTVGGGVFSENLSSDSGSSSVSSSGATSSTSTLSSAGTSSTSTKSSSGGGTNTVVGGSAPSATTNAGRAPTSTTGSSGSATTGSMAASSTSTGPATQKSNGVAGTGMQWGVMSLSALVFGGLLM
ncbi:SMP-30 gluconolaconase LRE domain protein [Xylographa soralifera]|nr:SMP-30 gluconolaconase LRE domain protein [Xylographa soralifera]